MLKYTVKCGKKQYDKGLLSKTTCSASESVVRLIYGDLGQTYVQFWTFALPPKN